LRKPNNLLDQQTNLQVAYSPNEHIPYSPIDHAKQVINLVCLRTITASFRSYFTPARICIFSSAKIKF
jgi:hypothetical protein